MRKALWSVLLVSALAVACSDPIEPPRMPPNEEEEPDPNDTSQGMATLLEFATLA